MTLFSFLASGSVISLAPGFPSPKLRTGVSFDLGKLPNKLLRVILVIMYAALWAKLFSANASHDGALGSGITYCNGSV